MNFASLITLALLACWTPANRATAQTGCATPPSGLISWWRAEGNTSDSIGSNNGAPMNGATFATGKAGQGFSLNGASQFVQVPHSPSLNLTNAFTLEFWYKQSVAGSYAFIAKRPPGNDLGPCNFGFNVNSGTMFLYFLDPAFPGNFRGVEYPAPSVGVFHHLAGSYRQVDVGNVELKIFIDGQLVQTQIVAGNLARSVNANVVTIGADNATGFFLNGIIDEVSIYGRALSTNEVQAIYNAGAVGKCASPLPPTCVTPPSGLVSWWRAENSTLDQVDGNHGTLVGNMAYGPARVGKGFIFDGDGDAVQLGSPTNMQLQNFTIEAWVKRSSASRATTDPQYIQGAILSYGYGGYCFAMNDDGRIYLSKVWFGQITSTISVTDTNYHHVAVTKSGSTVTFYVDGVADVVGTYEPGFTFGTTVNIGARGDDLAHSFWGAIDELSVYNRALSPAEIQALYNVDGAGKCASPPPPTCVTPRAGLVSWWRGETNANDAADGNNGTLLNGAGFVPGTVGQAFSFDGTNDYVEVPDVPALRLTNELTVEFWVKRQRLTYPSYPYADYIIEKGGDWTGGALNYSVALHNSRYNYCLHFVFAGGWRGAGSIADFNWHHCAVVARHGQVDPTFYIDGVAQPVVYREGASTINLHPSTRPLHIGAQLDPNTGWFYFSKTHVDELGLYNRALSATEIQAVYNAGSAGKCVVAPTCTPAPSSIAGWWAAESNANDFVSGNNGVLRNGATFAAGRVNQAFSLDGVNDFVDIASAPNFGTSDFAVEFWVKFNTLAGEQVMVEKYIETGVASRTGWTITKLANNTFRFAQGGLNADVNFGAALANTWTHVAVARSNGVVRAYLNGLLSTSVSTRVNLNTTASLKFGHRGHPSDTPGSTDTRGFYLNGLLDEVEIYSRALSAAEIQALYNAGSSGKCKEPPVIFTQPVSQKVTVGDNVNFSIIASGTPQLHYQWQFNGDSLAGATGSALNFTVSDASAGWYSVRLTNAFGSVISSNALLTVNHRPHADATATKALLIVPAGCNPTVVLDGSRSSDPDGDPLQYRWFKAGETNAFATGVVAVVTLPLGAHAITLVVNDGLTTDAQTITVELITPAQAVERLIALVKAQSQKPQPLVATLSAALASIERGHATAAINQLEAFQNKVRVQVAPDNPALAEQFIRAAQNVIDALLRDCASTKPHGKIGKVHRHGNGRVAMEFSAPSGQLHLVEASTNLLDWETIGVASETGPGQFAFEDPGAVDMPTRFYRIVSP